jgi:spore coat protein A, manganese oxidase
MGPVFAGRLARAFIVAVLLTGSVAFVADRVTRDAQRAAAATPPPTIRIPRLGAVFGFKPKTLTINKGHNVRVINNDSTTHTVTANKHNARNRPLFNVRMPAHSTRTLITSKLAPGRYGFHCTIHPNMTGVLIVKGKGGGISGAKQTFNTRLRIPRVLTGSRVHLAIRRTQVQVFAHGPATWMWTYGGSYPAPTIRRPGGQDTKVTVTDYLPGSDGRFTVHLHGDHHQSIDDGRPNDNLITSGHSVTYDYPLTDSGGPERAGFLYYHDHRMGFTGRNNWMGMQGMFIIDNAGAEHGLGLPSGSYDVPIMVSDRSFNNKNQLTVPFSHSGAMVTTGPTSPPNDTTVGDRILVNGTYAPHFAVATHRYRLRLLNASNFQSYDFKLSDGRAFTQIGSGDSLLPHRVTRKDILLGPSQRADVIVNFGGELHKNVVLKSVPRVNRPTNGIGTPTASLMQFRVTRSVKDGSRVPFTLRQPPKLASVNNTFTWRIGVVHKSTGSYWTINGKMFAPKRVDHTVKLGSTEQWTLVNNTNVTHYLHLHEEQWQTISRDGHAPAPWEKGLQDTWKLDPGEQVVVQATFTDYTGEFMLHCHMLDHEDHGLMAQFDVVP